MDDGARVRRVLGRVRGVIGMHADRQEHRPHTSGIAVSSEWSLGRKGEPRLEELMEDPMMSLIWRRDGLEPVRARETLRELQAIVQAGRQAAC